MSGFATVFVLTLRPDDGGHMHAICESRSQAAALLARLRARVSEDVIGTIDEKAATWECDGRDGCLQDA